MLLLKTKTNVPAIHRPTVKAWSDTLVVKSHHEVLRSNKDTPGHTRVYPTDSCDQINFDLIKPL